jgi:hypothetical protein
LAIAEGFEDAACCTRHTGIPTWVALSAARRHLLAIPEHVETIVIAEDNDPEACAPQSGRCRSTRSRVSRCGATVRGHIATGPKCRSAAKRRERRGRDGCGPDDRTHQETPHDRPLHLPCGQ